MNDEQKPSDDSILDADAGAQIPSVAGEGIEAPRKRRGRKSNAEKAAEAAIAGDTAKTIERPKRREKLTGEAKTALARQLQGLHLAAAQITQLGELMVSEAESLMLADALVNISEQYGLELTGKTGALVQLLGTAALIYLPRFHAINQRSKMARAANVSDGVVQHDTPIQ